jgi:hypothetical protein
VTLKERAAANCPRCGTSAAPCADSTITLAWYECACGEHWGCRLRNGVPGTTIAGELAIMTRQMMSAA